MNTDRQAIVIGGAGGIGSEICRRLASEGYRVIVADYSLERGQDVLRSLYGEGHGVVQLDITNEESVDAAFDSVEARFPVSILIVASGGLLTERKVLPSVASMTAPEWERTIAYNLTGVFFCMRKFARLRLAKPLDHSRIITLTSGAGQIAGTPTDMGYVASKAAIIGITRQAAFELVSAGVTVNAVAPGPIGTPEFWRNTNDQIRAAAAGVSLVNRLGTPEEVAASVAFLASSEASYITGTTLDVNGGSHMH